MADSRSPEGDGPGPAGSTLPKFSSAVAATRLELSIEQEGGHPSDRKAVLDGDFFRIGSHESNDLVLDDPRVSRFHCTLSRGKSAWRIQDAGSLNGTSVAGVPLRDADVPLPGCIVELGDSRVRVRELANEEPNVEILDQPSFGDLYGSSVAMRRLFAVVARVAAADANVLIEGESGTGKELVATEIVRRGPRARKPFVIIDCGAISPALIESELFGHKKGAFTGAERDRAGAFEAAHGGTVFLDEIGEMPLEMQPKLLRALEAREIRRLGETSTRKVDVRVIAATNRRLEREVNHGRFREDLFFRLSVVTVRLPPLRERLEDLEILVNALLESLGATDSAHLFGPDLLKAMLAYEWPGNVRELKNFVERSVVLQSTSAPLPSRMPEKSDELRAAPAAQEPIDIDMSFRLAKERAISEFERRYLTSLLEWSEGNISRAARKAGMDRMNLHRLVQRYGLREPRSLKD